ncbi:MAG: DUF1926 domain-containing protein [Candidatus Omnitrophica bacterium]|nr:DUF1926 domain-containing protein [Candidatus Omnitrophota bacterium]
MRADLVMAIHFHQPVGNFDKVINRACDRCYIPFLKLLGKYPDIKMSLHFTGCLLEWAEEHRPEIISMVQAMVKSGQVEIIGGGFYEPIFSSIPEKDRYRQIQMLNKYVKNTFGSVPQGAWVAERVWEPNLPSLFYDTGIKYVVLDDTHFIHAGISKDKTYGYYITEDNGKQVAVFPSDKILRYHIPYKMPEDCMNYIRDVAGRMENPVFVYGDDAEKFGEWPGTHKWVFEEKWLEKFFEKLIQNAEWLNTVKLSDCLKNNNPIGKVYIGATSYDEMLEWSLPADAGEYYENVMDDIGYLGKTDWYKPFIRGGFWRNFMAKYPESDNMNKKMLYVSKKLREIEQEKINKNDLVSAERELLKGQCNCAFWHGVFGGLYLFHLRQAIYKHLIKSESIIDNMVHGDKDFCVKEIMDIDADGFDEVIVKNRQISLYIDPAEGGVLKELDARILCENLTNSIARRKESYHRKILKKAEQLNDHMDEDVKTIHEGIQVVTPGVKDHIVYDRHNRYSFIDHFCKPDININSVKKCTYEELGDFVNAFYNFKVKKVSNGESVVMERQGMVDSNNVLLKKEFRLPEKGSVFVVKYSIENKGDSILRAVFSPEFNITMPQGDSDRYSVMVEGDKPLGKLSATFAADPSPNIKITDETKELSVEFVFTEACRIYHFPLKTVSQSEKAYELNYQGSVILPLIELDLRPGEEKQFEVEVRIF